LIALITIRSMDFVSKVELSHVELVEITLDTSGDKDDLKSWKQLLVCFLID